MKKIKILLFIFIFIFSIFILKNEVYAKENDRYYTNYNNIRIKYEDYEELKKYYSESFIYSMTLEEYKSIMKNDLKNIEVIEQQKYKINPLSTSFSTSYKSLKIINNNGYITISLIWKIMPKVRSYDVIAARFKGVKISGVISFKQTYVEDNYTYVSYSGTKQEFSNGLGYSFKLSTKDYLESSLSFWISGSGTIFASYQHAQKVTTLAQSKKYTLSVSGYGGVILFDDSVKAYYDAMSGVSINV